MSQFNKTTASVLAGAICSIAVWGYGAIYPGAPALTPEVQAALQTIITAAVVYFGPANAA